MIDVEASELTITRREEHLHAVSYDAIGSRPPVEERPRLFSPLPPGTSRRHSRTSARPLTAEVSMFPTNGLVLRSLV
jgi:hypothetical protein